MLGVVDIEAYAISLRLASRQDSSRVGVSGESSSDTPGSLSSNLAAGFESCVMLSLSITFYDISI
jgi:hypothetical protein